jgi:hypothetical protein
MLKQIHLHELTGGTLKSVSTQSDKVYLVFDNGTFVAFEPCNVYDQLALRDLHITIDANAGLCGVDSDTCIELGIFTREEWAVAEAFWNKLCGIARRRSLENELARIQKQLKELA